MIHLEELKVIARMIASHTRAFRGYALDKDSSVCFFFGGALGHVLPQDDPEEVYNDVAH